MVLKLAGNIHPADSQITAITRHDMIVDLLTGHGKSSIFKCTSYLIYVHRVVKDVDVDNRRFKEYLSSDEESSHSQQNRLYNNRSILSLLPSVLS